MQIVAAQIVCNRTVKDGRLYSSLPVAPLVMFAKQESAPWRVEIPVGPPTPPASDNTTREQKMTMHSTRPNNVAAGCKRRCLSIILLACTFTALSCIMSVAVGHTQPASAKSPKTYRPPAPNPKDFDWIRLTSGEWLKGNITLMRDDKLEFDSDKLDDLSFDWEDVVELVSPRRNTCLFEGRVSITGTLLIRDDIVVVGGETEQRFKREDLLAIVPGEPTEWNFWSGDLSLNVAVRRGNADRTDLQATALAQRDTTLSRLKLDYLGNFGATEDETDIDNHRLGGKYDRLVTRRFFVTPLAVTAFRDPFQNIAWRVTPGAGVGYHLFKRSNLRWEVGLLGGMQYTRYDSAPAGEDEEDTAPAIIFSTHFEREITSRLDFLLDYNVAVEVPNTTNANHHLLTELSVDVIGALGFNLRFVWDRAGDPQADADGNVPVKDDFYLTFGLKYAF